MKRFITASALIVAISWTAWAQAASEWPTEDATIQVNNKGVSTFYKDGTTWAHRADVADALGLPKDGEEMVDLQAAFRERGGSLRRRQSGVIDAVIPQASARSGAQLDEAMQNRPRSYYSGGGSYSSSHSVKSRSSNGGHTKNYTPYKNQTDEYFHTHVNGRVFNLQSGEYKTGQENRVFVDGYTTKNGTTVNSVTRRYPGSSSSGTYSGGNSGGQGIPGSPNPNP